MQIVYQRESDASLTVDPGILALEIAAALGAPKGDGWDWLGGSNTTGDHQVGIWLSDSLAAQEQAARAVVEVHLSSGATLGRAMGKALADNMALMQRFITAKPFGAPRYDGDLKATMADEDNLHYRTNAVGHPLVTQVRAWMDAVQAYGYSVALQIGAAATVEAVEALRLTYDDFEARFGTADTAATLKDPDYTAVQIKAWRA